MKRFKDLKQGDRIYLIWQNHTHIFEIAGIEFCVENRVTYYAGHCIIGYFSRAAIPETIMQDWRYCLSAITENMCCIYADIEPYLNDLSKIPNETI